MNHRFVRCPHCKMPHEAGERVCPTTGLRIPEPARARMAEVPPPSRRPEPLAFEPRAARRPPRSASSIDSSVSLTRRLKHELIGQTVGGRYVVKGILGEGGMGTVYDAEHIGLARNVAIKVLAPSQAKKRVAVKRFQQEARAAGAIGHPNICEVYDLGLIDDGSPYLVMEKLVGQTLADRIAREGGLPFDELSGIMMQVLSGLMAAHEKGIVHRDIKPENIFLARRTGAPPIAKILDFGVSKMTSQFQGGEAELDLTRTGMVMGTPYYMSPEQARGERNLDGRVDVYACGVMMYEAIAGKRPYLAPNYNALLLAIINTTPRPLKEIRPATPAALEVVVGTAMSKSRDSRYPSAMHLLRDIQALGLTRTGGGSPARVPPPPSLDERRKAPVLGGREIPSNMLRARMNDSSSMRTAALADSDSIDIPIDVVSLEGEDFDEGPTAIYRHDVHGTPQAQPARFPAAGRPPAPLPAAGRPPAPLPAAGRPPELPPVDGLEPTKRRILPMASPTPRMSGTPGSTIDDWEAQTTVVNPGSTKKPVRRIGVEETTRTNDPALDNIDFDETRIGPPPQPPRRR